MAQAMMPDGFYDENSAYQMRGALSDAELVAHLAGELAPTRARGTIVIADYGCAQGRVSNTLIQMAIDRLRSHEPEMPIAVYHNDLLGNDWAALFDRLRDPHSYLHSPGGPVTPLISATSFYNPVTPPGIVDLGMSFAAAQWLSQPGPRGCGSALYFDQLDGPARAEMAAQALHDWTQFLTLRAQELAPKARLIVNMMGVSRSGIAAGHALWQHLRAVCSDMATEGKLDRTRVNDYVIPIYERNLDEVRRPFNDQIGQRLQLESLSLHAIANPATERYRSDGDSSAFAREFSGFVRAWSEPSLREAFSADDAVFADLYQRLESRLRDAAADFVFEVHAIRAVIRRRG